MKFPIGFFIIVTLFACCNHASSPEPKTSAVSDKNKKNVSLWHDPKNFNPEYVSSLLAQGAEVDEPEEKMLGVSHLLYYCIHETPLDWQQLAFVKVLLKNGANPNASTLLCGSTPLHFSAQSCDTHLTQLLIDYKAEVNAKNALNLTPLLAAVVTGTEWLNTPKIRDCFWSLINAGAIIQHDDKLLYGKTIIHHAAVRLPLELFDIFLKKNLTLINAQDDNGNTALHLAILEYYQSDRLKHRLSSAVMLLLHAGAKMSIKNKNGDTPLHLACGHPSRLEIIKLLANQGDINQVKNIANNENALPFDCLAKLPETYRTGNFLFQELETASVLMAETLYPDNIPRSHLSHLYEQKTVSSLVKYSNPLLFKWLNNKHIDESC